MSDTIKPIDAFYHPPAPDPMQQGRNYGNGGVMQNIAAFNVGVGNDAFYANTKQGIWLGNKFFAQAPFSVNMKGQITVQDILGKTILDPSGIKSDTQFLSNTIEDFTDRTTALDTPSDIPFTEIVFTIQRPINVFLAASLSGYISGLTGGAAGDTPTGIAKLKIDGVLASYQMKIKQARLYTPEATGLTVTGDDSRSYQKLSLLQPGQHKINLSFYLLVAGSYTFHVTETSLTSITFGT